MRGNYRRTGPGEWPVTRAWGDRWLQRGQSALLVVRSILVPETYNILVNPRHADAEAMRQLAVFPCPP
jgi:RES domain